MSDGSAEVNQSGLILSGLALVAVFTGRSSGTGSSRMAALSHLVAACLLARITEGNGVMSHLSAGLLSAD